jgi:hypothetical protein
MAFCIALGQSALTRLGYERESLELRLNTLRKENGEREVLVASLGSPARIQQLAEARLGMRVPAASMVLAISEASPGGVSAAGAAEPSQPARSPASESLLAQIWHLLLRLGGRVVEAATPGR